MKWNTWSESRTRQFKPVFLSQNYDCFSQRIFSSFSLSFFFFLGEMGTVAGWGRLSEGGQLPNILQYVSISLIIHCFSSFKRSHYRLHKTSSLSCKFNSKMQWHGCVWGYWKMLLWKNTFTVNVMLIGAASSKLGSQMWRLIIVAICCC